MDNPTRSQRSRNAALEAALAVIERDGPGRLTLDAIARESGISKGGLMHQFPTKEAVIKALLDRRIAHFEDFSRRYREEFGAGQAQPNLAAQVATLREAIATRGSAALAILGAIAHDPSLLSATRDLDDQKLAAIKAEAADPDLAILRWVSAWGLTLMALLGVSSFSAEDRDRLFERLLDDRQWAPAPLKRSRTRTAAKAKE